MWIGNPSQAKVYRSPWFQEQIFPFGEGVENVQNKGNNQRLDQFGAMLSEVERRDSIPGPIIRTQGYPNSSPSPQKEKHESTSIFYNYEEDGLIDRGYKTAPYWRFGQWSYVYPEYIKLTCSQSTVGSIQVGESESGPVLSPIELGSFNFGTFLLKQSSGYLWTLSNPAEGHVRATNPNVAWSVTYVPCYSHTSKNFPSRFCNWSLSFRPFDYSVNSLDFDVTLSPFTWVLSCANLSTLLTTNYLEITPAPTSGGIRLTYGSSTITLTNWVDTGNVVADAETFRNLLQVRLSALASGDSVVTTEVAETGRILYKITIDHSTYQVLTLHTNTLTDGSSNCSITITEDVSGGYEATSATFMFFTPQSGFSQPDGTCKDTRDIGIFDRPYMTTFAPGEENNFLLFGESKSEDGLSHGSISFKKSTRWRIHTATPTDLIDSTPSKFGYPGWNFPALSYNPGSEVNNRYPIYERDSLFTLTTEPIYL